MEPTLPDKHRTYGGQEVAGVDLQRHNPWRAPGYAPIEDPCGIAGGWYQEGAAGNGGIPPLGIKQGMRGGDLPEVKGLNTVWKAGSTVEVSWDLIANHG